MTKILPTGAMVTRQELMRAGMSRHAIDNLLKTKQLVAHAQGVYGRPDSQLTWQGIVYSLQRTFSDFTVGGLTALELQGLGHYVPMGGKKNIHLYGHHALPKWVNHLLPDAVFIRHSGKELMGRLFKTETSAKPLSDSPVLDYTFVLPGQDGTLSLIVSVVEKACLEMLMDVPQGLSFEHADQLMQGMTNLSPKRLQHLLEKYRNVKVRRLFLWFAERQNYTWLNKLDLEKISLGSGNRMLLKGGKLNTKYKISVPEDL